MVKMATAFGIVPHTLEEAELIEEAIKNRLLRAMEGEDYHRVRKLEQLREVAQEVVDRIATENRTMVKEKNED